MGSNSWGRLGFEARIPPSQSENHTPRPTSHAFKQNLGSLRFSLSPELLFRMVINISLSLYNRLI